MTRLVLSLIISYIERGARFCGGRKLVLMFCGEVVVVVQEIFYYHKGINAIFLIVYPSVSGTTQCVNNVVSTV